MNVTFSTESADPASVIRVQADKIIDDATEIASGEVLIEFLAFPINPQDLMAIAGKYPVKPVYKHSDGAPIPGNDGIAEVKRLGKDVEGLQVGDHVLPKRHGLGTWRHQAILPATSLIKLAAKVDPVSASLLKMGFLPAYFLIEDMRKLAPGDWIIVNAGQGVIPQMVAQFARLRGCNTVAVVRQSEDGAAPAASGSAAIVVTEEALEQQGKDADPRLAGLVEQQKIVLALDAVFGSSAERLASLLATGATFVNYGSLGGADGVLRLSQGLLFWKQITFRNFRLSQQLATRSDGEQERLLAWCASLLADGRLTAPAVDIVSVSINDTQDTEEKVRRAVSRASERRRGVRKHVVVLGVNPLA